MEDLFIVNLCNKKRHSQRYSTSIPMTRSQTETFLNRHNDDYHLEVFTLVPAPFQKVPKECYELKLTS